MADTKNYGLKGIGDDVQLGKAGGRFVYNTGASDFRVTTDGSTLAHIQVLTPVSDTDAATKLYVDDTAAGLDVKESVTCATTADMGATYSSVGGTSGNGNFTGVPATIDGVTLAEFDRVLVKNEADAKENGIYVVTSTTTTIERATDHDSDAEVSAGNFTFVEEGTVNADTGWVLQGPDPLAINTQDLDFVLFSTSGTLVAGEGLVKNGNLLDLDFSELTDMTGTISGTTEFILQDGTTESRKAASEIGLSFFNDDLGHVENATHTGQVTGSGALVLNPDATAITAQPAHGTIIAADTILSNDGGVLSEASFTQMVTFFDANITFPTPSDITVADEASDVTSFPLFVTAATGDLGPKTNAGLTFNASTANLNSTLIAGIANANLLDKSATETVSGAYTFTGGLTVTTSNIVAGTVNADFDAVTATSYGGITEANLVDKSTTETISDKWTFEVDSATTAADIPVIRLSATSSGTPLVGIGPSIEFQAETAAGGPGNQEIGGLFALEATDVTGASEDFDFVFQLMAGGGTAAEVARITSTGNLTLSGTVDGIDIATDVAANTAKVTNATHTGQVIGSGALTLNSDATAITDQPATGAIVAADTILINDGGVLSEATFTQMNTYFDSSLSFGSGDGTVTSSGTPLNNEVAVFATGTDINSDSTFTWDATTLVVNELSFAGDTISNNTTDQPLILRPNGTGSIIFQNGSGEEILELNDVGSAINGLAITPGTTGNPAQITTGTGSEADIDIGFLTNGIGVITVVSGSGNYEDNVTADDDIPNKKYVDDAIEAVGGSGTLDSVTGSVDLTTASTQNIGSSTGIPINATILSVTLDVDLAADDAVTTVTVGDATNGAASYMAATENDPEVIDTYIANGYLLNGAGTRQATATVAVPATNGTATCIITFRHA